jgi:fructuronate reductase
VRLGPNTLGLLDKAVARPAYDRQTQTTGIVHLGLGAFHRAHQAVYTDDAMNAGDRHWSILGVSLRSPAVRDQVQPQAGLYTVSERAENCAQPRLIGSIGEVLVAPEDPTAVIRALAAPTTKVITLTVTEKGYHRSVGDSGWTQEVRKELAGKGFPSTMLGYLQRGLAKRRTDGLPGLTLLSCDNLAENGALLRAQLMQYFESADPALARWFDAECECPASMVDRIVPATTSLDVEAVEGQIGLRDEGAVITEPFSQWVIEDRFAGPRPRWEAGGAQFVQDVRPFETAKLRMLNGAHSALAYLGLERGYEFVHEAVADAEIGLLVERLVRLEAAPTVPIAVETDKYATELLARFANSGLPHRLKQIAMDGSQKIPQRWLATLSHYESAVHCPAIVAALASWLRFVRGETIPVEDPMAHELAELWRDCRSEQVVGALFGPNGHFRLRWDASCDDLRLLERQVNDADLKLMGQSVRCQ